MKTIILSILLIVGWSDVFAGSICYVKWETPTERENCIVWNKDKTCKTRQPLSSDEIANYNVWIFNEGEMWENGGVPIKEFKVRGKNNKQYPYFWKGPCPKCTQIRMTTVDTDGRESLYNVQQCEPNAPVLCQ